MWCLNVEEDWVVVELKKKLGNFGDFLKEEFVVMMRFVLESVVRVDGNVEGVKVLG